MLVLKKVTRCPAQPPPPPPPPRVPTIEQVQYVICTCIGLCVECYYRVINHQMKDPQSIKRFRWIRSRILVSTANSESRNVKNNSVLLNVYNLATFKVMLLSQSTPVICFQILYTRCFVLQVGVRPKAARFTVEQVLGQHTELVKSPHGKNTQCSCALTML